MGIGLARWSPRVAVTPHCRDCEDFRGRINDGGQCGHCGAAALAFCTAARTRRSERGLGGCVPRLPIWHACGNAEAPADAADARVRRGTVGGAPLEQASRARRLLRELQGLRHHLGLRGARLEHDRGPHEDDLPVGGCGTLWRLRSRSPHRPRVREELPRAVFAAALHASDPALGVPAHVLGKDGRRAGGAARGVLPRRGRRVRLGGRRAGAALARVAAHRHGAGLHAAEAQGPRDPDRLSHRSSRRRLPLRRHPAPRA